MLKKYFLSFVILFTNFQIVATDNLYQEEKSIQEINPEKKKLIDVIESYRAFQKDTLNYYLDLKDKLTNIENGKDEAEKICPGITKHSDKENMATLDNFIINIQKNISSCDDYRHEILETHFICYIPFLEELIAARAQFLNNRYFSFMEENHNYGNNFEKYCHVSTLSSHQKNLSYAKRFEAKILIDNFLFFNNFIKLLYRIVPNRCKNNLTNFYVNISPHLKDHLNSEPNLEKKLSPDECILDGLNYASAFDKDQCRYIPQQKSIIYGRNILEINPKLKSKDLEKRINKDKSLTQKSKTMEKNLEHLHQLSVRSKISKNATATSKNKRTRYQKSNHLKPSLDIQSHPTEKEEIKTQNLILPPAIIKSSETFVDGFIDDECYRVPERYKAPVVKEKVKTRSTAITQTASKDQVEKSSSSEDPSNDITSQVTHHISGQLLTLFDKFWDLKAGFTYQEFKTLFGKFKGIIEEDSRGSHVTLKYEDSRGVLHTGGTWRPHGKASEYGYESTKYLKRYMTHCRLTPNFIKPKSEQLKE